MKLILYNLLFIISISCCTTKQENSFNNEKLETDNQLMKEMEFEVIFSSEYGGNDEFNYLIIDNSTDLSKEIERLNISNELPDIDNTDFGKKVILFLHLGQKNTGGYEITVDKLEKIKDEIIIYTNLITPEKGENVTMALTNPYCIAILPKAKSYSIK